MANTAPLKFDLDKKVEIPGAHHSGALATSFFLVGDFDGNGIQDVAQTDADWPTGSVLSPLNIWYGQNDSTYIVEHDFTADGEVYTYFTGFLLKGDFNLDGIDDLYMATYGNEQTGEGEPDVVLLSDGNGGMVKIEDPILANNYTWSHGSSIGDLDGDGDIDIFQAGAKGTDPHLPVAGSKILLNGMNSGPVSFKDGTYLLPAELSSKLSRDVFSSLIVDLNNDGLSDLIIGHDGGHLPVDNGEYIDYHPTGDAGKVLFQNADGGFDIDVTLSTGSFEGYNTDTVDIDAFDINGDGYKDIVFSSYNGGWVEADNGDIKYNEDGNYEGNTSIDAAYQWRDIQLFVSDGEGGFNDETFRISDPGNGLGVSRYFSELKFVDINADGYADLVGNLSTDPTSTDYAGNLVWLNDSLGYFTPFDLVSVLEEAGRTSVWNMFTIDADNDGDLDIAYGGWGPIPGTTEGGGAFEILFNDTLKSPAHLYGGKRNDSFINTDNSDFFHGGEGIDIVSYSDSKSKYETVKVVDGFLVKHGSINDTLENIERVIFSDGAIASDISGNAGQAYRLYQAAFDRTPDLEGLGYWINSLDKGMTLEDMASGFIASEEFTSLYGVSTTDDDFVDLLYRNVLAREADQMGYEYWIDQIQSGLSRSKVLSSFSESIENQANVIGEIQHGVDFILWS